MIYENILKMCKEKGMTIYALEKESGLGNATIRGWSNSNPRVDKLKAVADVLGCSIEDLLK